MDFFTFFVLVCLASLLVYARIIEKRRRRDAEEHDETLAALTKRIHALEQEARQPQPAMPWTPSQVPAQQAVSPPPTPPAKPAPAATPPIPRTPIREETKVQGESAKVVIPPKPAAPMPPATLAVSASAGAATAKPATEPPVQNRTPQNIVMSAAPAAAASHAAPPATAGMSRPTQISSAPKPSSSVPFGGDLFERVQKKSRNISLEELVGTNWLPKLGITILVLAIVLFTATKWEHLPAIGRVLVFYVLGAGLLTSGIFLEGKERYRILGRVLIGGGWAVLFFITFAMRYVPAARVLDSDALDLLLLLGVTCAMVWHTLKYNSQTVTGFAFFLGFLSIGISHNSSLSLIAGALLAMGLTVIVLRRQWYQLEVFGILASYVNHALWIDKVFSQFGHHPFPQYPQSVALMVGYWAIFRTSYLVRKVGNEKQEAFSTAAALLNALGFIATMKYQSFHPEWAFYALLTLGAIEFTLGQLPVSHRRRTPFQILSSLGATLMVMSVPFKYSGSHSLEMLWMAGAEAFLLAGVFTRERLFRQFGGIISLLVAGYLVSWPPNGIVYQAMRIAGGQTHHDGSLSLALAVVAVLFYVNSHVIARIWESLFDHEVAHQAITVLSFAASVFTTGAIYAAVADNTVAIVLAILVTVLAWTAKHFRIPTLTYQAHWIAAVAILQASITGIHLDATWLSLPARLISLGIVAGLLYLSSNFVDVAGPWNAEIPMVLYRWAGTVLIALAIWMQSSYAAAGRREWLIAVLWTAFALVLAGVAQMRQRSEFRWQAFTLAMASFCCALVVNFDFGEQFHHLSYRLISVTLVAGGTYLLARWAPMVKLRPAYSWAGTILLGFLVYRETQEHYELWTAVLWIALAAVLGLAARYWRDRALLWQTHLLASTAAAWTIGIAFLGDSEYHGSHGQLITVLLTSDGLYGLTWITRIAGVVEGDEVWQAYSWAGSLLLTWLAWYQLQPINVSLAWGVFGLVLFELSDLLEQRSARSHSYLRLQTYVALVCSFAHLFYSNFNTPLAVGEFDPHIFLIVLLVPVYFWVCWRLKEKQALNSGMAQKLRVGYVLACLGTATVAALARFELGSEAVVVGYGAVVLGLLVTAWWTRAQVFLHQALVMLGVTAFRLVLHNFRNFNSSFVSSLPDAIWAIVLLCAGVPFALLLRAKAAEDENRQLGWLLLLIRRPEQPLFFVSSILLAVLLALKMHTTTITLSWCIEGILMILAGFFAQQRSFRLAGLALFLLSAGKVFAVDLRAVSDLGVRYLAMGGVGAVMVVAGYVFSRNRDALRKYL